MTKLFTYFKKSKTILEVTLANFKKILTSF